MSEVQPAPAAVKSVQLVTSRPVRPSLKIPSACAVNVPVTGAPAIGPETVYQLRSTVPAMAETPSAATAPTASNSSVSAASVPVKSTPAGPLRLAAVNNPTSAADCRKP